MCELLVDFNSKAETYLNLCHDGNPLPRCSSKRAENCKVSSMTINSGGRTHISVCRCWIKVNWPDVGWFGLQVTPALIHVIQSVLEEHGFLWAAQSLDHLRLVPVHTLVDVIVGVDLSLDVLEIQRRWRKAVMNDHFSWKTKVLRLMHSQAQHWGEVISKSPAIGSHSLLGCQSWLFMKRNNDGFCHKE